MSSEEVELNNFLKNIDVHKLKNNDEYSTEDKIIKLNDNTKNINNNIKKYKNYLNIKKLILLCDLSNDDIESISNLKIDSEIETTCIIDDINEYDIINKNIYISYKYNNNLFNIKLNYQKKRPHDHEFRSNSSYCISINNKINTGDIFNKILQYCNYDINQVVDTNVYNQYYNTIGVNTTKLEKLIENLL